MYSLDKGKPTTMQIEVFYGQFMGGKHSYEPGITQA